MVKFFLNLLGFAPLFATLAVAGDISVGYFYDDDCTNFASSPPVVPNNEEYNWEIAGTNSAGITNCTTTCSCWFYNFPNETIIDTPHRLAQYPGTNCVSGVFESFLCIAS